MATDLLVTVAAEEDIDRAYRWYEAERSGLGREFLNQFRSCVKTLVSSPEVHAIVSGNYRRALLRRFPYAVFYEFRDDLVSVYAVLHTSRDFATWSSRLV